MIWIDYVSLYSVLIMNFMTLSYNISKNLLTRIIENAISMCVIKTSKIRTYFCSHFKFGFYDTPKQQLWIILTNHLFNIPKFFMFCIEEYPFLVLPLYNVCMIYFCYSLSCVKIVTCNMYDLCLQGKLHIVGVLHG